MAVVKFTTDDTGNQLDLLERVADLERRAKLTAGTAVKKPKPKRPKQALMPVRHPTMDLFVCDVLDAIPKDDMGSMEHPMFTLSTKPDRTVRRYEHRGNTIEIVPSVLGLATIFDKDILIYCISQLMAKKNEGLPIGRTVRLTAYDLLVATNRVTSGEGYKLLRKAFDRLAGTRIKSNILSGGVRVREGFGWLDSWKIVEKTPDDSRMVGIKLTLSEWLFAAVEAGSVLTIHHDYFRLRKPLERRIYELARKHCGRQSRWRVGIDALHTKSGSSASKKEFARMVRQVGDDNYLPGYRIAVSKDSKTVTFYNRERKGRQAQVKDLIGEVLPKPQKHLR